MILMEVYVLSKAIIKEIQLENFTTFNSTTVSFAKNINILCGMNGVGKTHLMKVLYSVCATSKDLEQNKKYDEILADKLIGVFRPDELGRLVRRKPGRTRTNVKISLSNKSSLEFSLSTNSTKMVKTKVDQKFSNISNAVFIPVKEIISATENFAALYEEYHIAFEETYYDLNKQLLKPLKKGPTNSMQKNLLKTLEEVIDGKVVQENGRFYFMKPKQGKLEMGLLAEGYRKIATIFFLIANGTLKKDSILFWDEPESNMNPKMIPIITDLFIELSKMGVQLFITTHDYFLLKRLGMFAEYKNEKTKLDISFISMYKDYIAEDSEDITIESVKQVKDLNRNPIEEAFLNLYNEQQELFFLD